MTDSPEDTAKADRDQRVSAIVVSREAGGVVFSNAMEVMDFAKLMSKGGPCIPAYLQDNPGSCLYIVTLANEWRLSAYQLANASYPMTNRKTGETRIAFESSVYHAVIMSRIPFERGEEIRPHYEGTGEDLVCVVTATPRGGKPLEWRSKPLKEARPRRNEHGIVMGSPLWDKKPEVQLFYDTRRDLVRINWPHVMMGTYSQDDLEDAGWSFAAAIAKDVTPPSIDAPALHERLNPSALKRSGFNPDTIAKTLEPDTAPVEAAPETVSGATSAPSDAAPNPSDTVDVPQDTVSDAPAATPEEQAAGAPADRQDGKDRPPPTSAAPKAKKGSALSIPPKNEQEYITHYRERLQQCKSNEDIAALWSGELSLRNRCAVTKEVRTMLQTEAKMVAEKLSEILHD